MNDQERAAKLKEVFSDREFVKKMLETENAEEVQLALKGKGVDLSVEEIKAIRELIVRQMESGEELDKDQLKSVSGGILCEVLGLAALSAGLQATMLDEHISRRRRR